jgi:medium-chain acyl-[acyl-carrier-protein] hydrolase
MMNARADDWFVATSPQPTASIRLLAFTGAGGGVSSFAQQASQLPGWLEMRTLNLPGRQSRFDEPLCTDLDRLVAELSAACAELAGPYLMFGYCTGALIAYLVAQDLAGRGETLPRRLIVGSHAPPHLVSTPLIAGLDSDTLWQVLVEHRAVASEVADSTEFREIAEPILRADLGLISSYRYERATPLPVPITVLTGERDGSLASGAVGGWDGYSTAPLRIVSLAAGHWFMEEDPAAATAALVHEAELSR